MILLRRSAIGVGTRVVPSSSTLRSTTIREHFQNPSVQRVPFERVLLDLCERIVVDGSYPQLFVQINLRFDGTCPATHEMTVLRVVDELLCNAMEHGFYSRQRGLVFVDVVSRATVGVQVSVSDDGWGFDSGPVIGGNGFHLLRQVGDLRFGAATAPSVAKTTVTVVVPLPRRGRYPGLPNGSAA
jgi:two-component sensor histidine kinase